MYTTIIALERSQTMLQFSNCPSSQERLWISGARGGAAEAHRAVNTLTLEFEYVHVLPTQYCCVGLVNVYKF